MPDGELQDRFTLSNNPEETTAIYMNTSNSVSKSCHFFSLNGEISGKVSNRAFFCAPFEKNLGEVVG